MGSIIKLLIFIGIPGYFLVTGPYQNEFEKYVLRKPPEHFKEQIDYQYEVAKRLRGDLGCANLKAYQKLLNLENLAGSSYYVEIAKQKIEFYSKPCEEEKITQAVAKIESKGSDHDNAKTVNRYERPAKAPNGQDWPKEEAYLEGYNVLNTSGLSSVIVDNTQGSSDVMVKLVSLSESKNSPVRTVFIPKGRKFKMESVTQGEYDVRYMLLNDGSLMKSKPFRLKEEKVGNQTRFSNYSLTLYTVSDGNTRSTPIRPEDF